MTRTFEKVPSQTNWFRRAYYTPLSDALRGELSAALDVRKLIAAAELPQPLEQVVFDVVARSRLWRSEKVDVARELIAHFQDGLEAGRNAEELSATFGPTDQAARLIRTAKVRSRSWLWHGWRVLFRGVLVASVLLLITYGVFAIRYFRGSPVITRNFWHELNDARRVDDANAAWPLYRSALIALGDPSNEPTRPPIYPVDWAAGPSGDRWSGVVDYVARHDEALRLTRAAAAKPAFGYLVGNRTDHDVYEAAGATWLARESEQSAGDNETLMSARLDGVQRMRSLLWLLLADARVAAFAGDGDRAVADLNAAWRMAVQIRQPKAFLVEQLVSMHLFGATANVFGQILADTPDVFTAAQLRDFAHALAGLPDELFTIDFTAEDILYEDVLQRSFTDDGQGDGRLTHAGARWHWELCGITPENQPNAGLQRILAPGLSAFVAGRDEFRRMQRDYVRDLAAAHRGAAWTWDNDAIHAIENRLRADTEGGRNELSFVHPRFLFPITGGVFSAAERQRQMRDAIETAIALVLWHRQHHDWPTSLQQLVPALLPAVPVDRVDGQPLRYAVQDGKPVLYSVGVDRDDDGGRPCSKPSNAEPTHFGGFDASKPNSLRREFDGDWILWPPVPEQAESAATPAAESASPADGEPESSAEQPVE